VGTFTGIAMRMGNRTIKVPIMVLENKSSDVRKAPIEEYWLRTSLAKISAKCENFEVKVKVNRQISVSQEGLLLKFSAEKCCVYNGEKLV
jgi:glycerol transport system ATP-binding protein